MKCVITGLPTLTQARQQEIGQGFLIELFRAGARIDNVHIEFEEEEDS